MGEVKATLTLMNGGYLGMARHGFMKEEDVRQETVTAIVDTGSPFTVINETLRCAMKVLRAVDGIISSTRGKFGQYCFTKAR
jgi:hypothetical protein